METLYVVAVEPSISGSYYRPDIFQKKSDAKKFAKALMDFKHPSDRSRIHLYEAQIKEIEF